MITNGHGRPSKTKSSFMSENGWREEKKFVLSKLDDLQFSLNNHKKISDEKNEKIIKALNKIALQINTINVESNAKSSVMDKVFDVGHKLITLIIAAMVIFWK